MMNNRAILTLVVFIAWSAGSWWYYTCKIKGYCIGGNNYINTQMPVNETPPDTIAAVKSEKTITETATTITIHFPAGSFTKEQNKEVDDYLYTLANKLKQTGQKITITGHTDNTGEEQMNEELGMQRAQDVKNTLLKLGVDEKLITCISKGESMPVASNDTEEGRRQNRRVEIIFNQ